MTPFERQALKRAIFFYPWIRASAIWSVRFAAEHPFQTAAYARLGEVGEEWLSDKTGLLPFWLRGGVPVTEGETPWYINPLYLHNFDTLREVGGVMQGEESAFESLSPAFAAIYAGLTGESTLGYPVVGPVADAVGGRTGAALESALGYAPGYPAVKRATKEGGIVQGGRLSGLAQYGGGAFAGSPIDIEKARRAAVREIPGKGKGAETEKLMATIDVLERGGKIDSETADELRAVYQEVSEELDAEALRAERAALWRNFQAPASRE